MDFTDKELERIKIFCQKKVQAKTWEAKGFDDENRIKREMTGACVEFATRKFYGISNEFDDSITNNSFEKDFPDLYPSAICGCKGSFINQVPLVKKHFKPYIYKNSQSKFNGVKFRCADIIGVTNHTIVWLLGIASPEILSMYVDDNLFITASNNAKTGFYGATKLIDLPKNLEELQKITLKMMVAV